MRKTIIAMLMCTCLLTGCSATSGITQLFLGEDLGSTTTTYSRSTGEVSADLLDLDQRILSVEITPSEEAFLFLPKTPQKILITTTTSLSEAEEVELKEKILGAGIQEIEGDARITVKGGTS